MNRINVTFYDETYEKIEAHMRECGEKSIANTIRELVDLGLKVKESTKKNPENQGPDDAITMLIDLKNQMKSTLFWLLETRLLTRYMVENSSESKKEENAEILKAYKEKATLYVEKLLLEGIK